MTTEMVPQGNDIAQVLAGPEGDFLRRALEGFLRQLMEADVAARVGAGLHERSEDRTTWRNGYRPRGWETRVGPLMLQIPRLREGSYFPSFLEPRKRSERALVAVVTVLTVVCRRNCPARPEWGGVARGVAGVLVAASSLMLPSMWALLPLLLLLPTIVPGGAAYEQIAFGSRGRRRPDELRPL